MHCMKINLAVKEIGKMEAHRDEELQVYQILASIREDSFVNPGIAHPQVIH